jgi:hypothetical protein
VKAMDIDETYNTSIYLRFISETREGKYTEIVPNTLGTPRLPEVIEYIDVEEKDYYYSFDS